MSADEVAGLIVVLSCILLMILLPLSIPLYATIGGFRRRKATKDILASREPVLAHLVQVSTEIPDHPGPTALVHGTVAYAADFPARVATVWRNIVGGSARSLTEQADLARRLATVRMLEDAQRMGAQAVANVRIEANHIDMGSQRGRQALVIEMLVYGTALLPGTPGT